MGKIVKITDSTGECIEIQYDDDGNIVGKTISQQIGSNAKPANTGLALNKNSSSDSEVTFTDNGAMTSPDSSASDTESINNNLKDNPGVCTLNNVSHNIDKNLHNQQGTSDNYKEQYENFRKEHPSFSKNVYSDFSGSELLSKRGRYGIVVIAVFAVIILSIVILYKCSNTNGPDKPSTSIQESRLSSKAVDPSHNQIQTDQEQSDDSSEVKATSTSIFKLKLDQPPPPDCKVKLLNPIVILPNGNAVPATIFKIKIEGDELTGWTVDSYPLGSRFSCSATCE
jgi:hypothetical protein